MEDITISEIKEAINSLEGRNTRLYFMFLWMTGLSGGEARELTWDNFVPGHELFKCGKAWVKLPADLAIEIKRNKEDGLSGPFGELDRKEVLSCIRELSIATGWRFLPCLLSRSFATMATEEPGSKLEEEEVSGSLLKNHMRKSGTTMALVANRIGS